jgi:outer membrane receptor protein involved in Fe transport
MIHKSFRFLAISLVCFCVFSLVSKAQSTTEGAIAGTVVDSSGAVIAGAAVTLHNDGTDAEFKLVADSSGYFKAPLVPPGTYSVTISASGFGTYNAKTVPVTVGSVTELHPELKTGATQETVEVSGQVPILQFESPEVSSTMTAQEIVNLPLNGGRWSDMTLLTPAAVGDSNGFGLIAFRGISPILNNVEIDGADDNQAYYSEERGRTREGYSTSKYMIEEFQVNAGVYSAEFGRAAGGVINAISKSGSNALHGLAYFSDRDNDWGAVNPYTTNTINTSTTSAPTFETIPYKPIDWRKEWGFDAGGPLKRDKLFWFYGFAQYRRNFPGTAKAATPGSFFALPDASLSTGTCDITGANAGYISVPTGSTAASSVDQQACELAARLFNAGQTSYSTYAAGASEYSAQLVNLLSDLGSVYRTGNEELNTPKLDWQINEKNHLSALYHRLRWDSPGGVQTQATNTYAIDTFGTDFVKLDYGLTKLESQISSHLVNELRYQYGRELNDEGQQPYSAYTDKYLKSTNGINATAAGGFTPNVPEVALDTSIGFYLGSPYYSYRKALPDERKWQVGDTATWQKGNHGIKFGVDAIHNYDLIDNTYESNGVYTYSYIGNYFADILNEGNSIGVCNSVSSVTAPGSSTTDYVGKAPCGTFVQGFGPTTWDMATMDYGFFAEDHWKLSPRLTLDLGVRYDYESLPAPYSTLVTASGSFKPYLASTNGLCSAYTGPGTCPALAATANITNHPSDKNNIGPRIGLAWDPYGNGKSTVRLGYGIYYGRVTNGVLLNNLLNTGSPLGQYTSASIKPNNPTAPLFPNIIAAASGSAPTSYFFSKNFQNPQVHEFDLSIQRDLGHNTVAQISYMGAMGRELPNALNINLNPNANTAASGNPNGVIDSVITVSDSTGAGPLPNGKTFTVPTYTNLLNPNFGAVNELVSNINSSYNAGVAEIENKSSRFVQYDVNYTWSHALDYNQNETTTTLGSGVFDPYNIDGYYKGANYGNSAFNVENRLVAWALINAPNTQRTDWVKFLANDWSLNPVYQAQNGLPISATIGSGYPSYSAYNSSWNGAGTNYWIPAIGRDTYQMKRTMVVDMRLEKQLTMNAFDKPYHLQLLGEFFNVANHQNVTSESTTAYNLSSNSSVTSGCSSSLVPGQAQEECATMTFVPKTGSGVAASGFRAVTNTGSNFAYSPRQVQLSIRLDF